MANRLVNVEGERDARLGLVIGAQRHFAALWNGTELLALGLVGVARLHCPASYSGSPTGSVQWFAVVDATDAELLRAWAQGDEASAEALVKRHSRELFGFLRGRGARDVDDLMQQTLLDCLDHCRSGATIGNFRALLFAIARRRLVDEIRRGGGVEVVEVDAERLRDGRTSPSQGIARAQDERVVLEALRGLPLDTQILLELYYWRGFTGPDLARAMGLPEGTLRGRLRSARTELSRSVDAMRRFPIDLHDTLTRLADWKADAESEP